ncbi:hypothetical protein [Myxococcus sp. RHSTA-1-4]|uniref:hypothetical protein n=1 Tax=Myxococcus sp. RHSTA-1-4 TaxID=2874601 RepID=UPI001CBA924B|nr:hypothetical protein [Myxococcus sp. RHSTA-1-4]MBZ4417432.1 hypothetical protein [Myxococcus sp. RHSTA-1-4]
MADSRRPRVSVSVEKVPVEATVQSVTVEDDDRALDKATLVVDDPDGIAREMFREGLTLKVGMGWAREHTTLFEGEIVSSNPVSNGGVPRVSVTAYDLGYRLMQGPPLPPRNHVGRLSDIVLQVFQQGDSGVEVGTIAPDPDPEFTEENPLRPEPDERPWRFLQRLADRHGCRAFVEYNEGASAFYFVPVRKLLQAEPQGTLKYCRGMSQLIEFSYERIARAAAPVRSATVEDPLSGEAHSVAGPPPEPAPLPTPSATTRTQLASRGPTRVQQYDAALEVTARAPGNPSEQVPRQEVRGLPSDRALAETAIQQDPTRVLGFLGRGEAVGTVKLRAKGRVTIEGIASWAAGDWYVRQVRHVYTRSALGEDARGTYRTHFVVTR